MARSRLAAPRPPRWRRSRSRSLPITKIAESIGIERDELILYGESKAKVSLARFAADWHAIERPMQSLDGQVQEIKSDVLGIASDLNLLEERLLFPSHTQVSLFVSLADNKDFRLDAVQIEIDGELASHHIYSFKE